MNGRAVKYEMCPGSRRLFSYLGGGGISAVVVSPDGISSLRGSKVLSGLFSRSVRMVAIPPLDSYVSSKLVGSVRVRS